MNRAIAFETKTSSGIWRSTDLLSATCVSESDEIDGIIYSDLEILREVKRLSVVSETRSLTSIILQWIIIALSVWGCLLAASKLGLSSWPLYILSVAIIATRQHALLGLMHEGTHYRISSNRVWNDFLSDMFCAFPMGLSTELYRRQHFLHHRHTNTQEDPDWVAMHSDPDWCWPKDHITALKLFTFDLCGLAAHKILLVMLQWSPLQRAVNKHLVLSRSERLRLIVFVASMCVLFSVCHVWLYFLAFWIIPIVTVFGALVRLRSVAEHLVCESEHELNKTRHVHPTLLEKLTLAPVNVNYHIAHHLFPSVPFYNLPQLHRKLMRHPIFKQNAHITNSYLGIREGVLGEVLRKRLKASRETKAA